MPRSQRWTLERNARWYPDRTALRLLDRDETLTYADLDARVNQFANALRDRGLREGDRVALVLGNRVEFPVTLYACHKLGVVAVPLNYRLSTGELASVFDDTAVEAVVYGTQFADTVESAVDRTVRPADCICVGAVPDGGESYSAVCNSGASTPPPELDRDPEAPSYIIYTSGTTGEAKGVVHTARSAKERVSAALTAFEFHPQTVCLSQLPFVHGGGLVVGVRATLTIGGTLLIAEDYADVDIALDAIETHGVTHLAGAPTVTNRFLDRADIDDRDLSSVEAWYHTGEVMTETRATAFTETLTPNIYNSYGSSEGGIITALHPESLPEEAGTAGVPTLGTEIRVIEVDSSRPVLPDETVPEGETGAVILSSDQLFAGYYGRADATRDAVRDGWYYTGDLGVFEDGVLTITGRVDDVIVSGGELISPAEVEDILETHDRVEAAVVVGIPDEEWGERVVAYVVGDATADDLDDFCRASDDLADFKRPREYEFVDEIEYTESGKKRRTAYRSDA